MYLHDDSVVFCTLAVKGPKDDEDRYRTCVRTMIESIIKFTHNRAVIVTDVPEAFGNEYGPRITFIKFDESLTPLTLMGATGQFQYSLKLVPIRETMKRFEPTVIVWLDADAFLFGWNRDFEKFFRHDGEGLYGRMRGPPSEPRSDKVILNKVINMGYNPADINAPVPIESLLFFKTGPNLIPLMNTWENLALMCHKMGLNSDYEAVDFCIALNQHQYKCTYLDNNFPHVDNFRILHDRKIFTPIV